MSKKIVKKSPIDFKVKVIIYGLPTSTKKEIKEIVSYLKKLTDVIEKKDNLGFSKRFIAKLTK